MASVLDIDNIGETIASFQSVQDSAAVAGTSRRGRITACVPDIETGQYKRPPRMPDNTCDANIFANSTPVAGCCIEENWISMHNILMLWHVRHAAPGTRDLVPAQEIDSIKRFLTAAFFQLLEDGSQLYTLPVPNADAASQSIETQCAGLTQLAQEEPFLFLTGAGSRDTGLRSANERDRVLAAALPGVESIPYLRVYIGRSYGRGADARGTQLQRALFKRCAVLSLWPYNIKHYRLPQSALNAETVPDTVLVSGLERSTVELDSLRCIRTANLIVSSFLILPANMLLSSWWERLLWETGRKLVPAHTDQQQVRMTLKTDTSSWNPAEDAVRDIVQIHMLQMWYRMAVEDFVVENTVWMEDNDHLSMTSVLVLPPPLGSEPGAESCCIEVSFNSNLLPEQNYVDVRIWWHAMPVHPPI